MITNQKISLEQKVIQGKANIVSNMGSEKVMLSIENGKYYNLGEMGGCIWDLMNVPVNIVQIITILISRYDVDRKECEEQVISFLNTLLDEGLIEVIA
ncbi:lasso peptide biosynthesis PqqD family chaperone [Cytobacillus firmus]|uniref:lasso peptide biosynthesis PqqD family chaperone n=1 Tax=Cytobacillus firmus TaxID=1399 RepID=UPI001CFCB394|nr:lasso peptide biosynthesis PqqD family chaperone [Cytobacillus firmus]URT70231.1 lasso peptide biosynthesis PqqD family chaperone [Cytobacillus firmus]